MLMQVTSVEKTVDLCYVCIVEVHIVTYFYKQIFYSILEEIRRMYLQRETYLVFSLWFHAAFVISNVFGLNNKFK